MSSIRLTVAQFAANLDIERNRRISTELIAAAGGSSDLVVLPENAMYSDPKKERPDDKHAEPLDGEYVTAVQEAAAAANTAVVAGFTEINADDAKRPFNTLVYVTADGQIGGTYRKIHLYDAFGYRESDSVTAAPIDKPLVFELGGVTIGAATCYDVRFPEMMRWIVDAGADAIVLPAAWAVGPMKELHWETLVRARAIENTVYFAACGQTGPDCTGQSMVVDPMGVIAASAGEAGESFATAIVDTDRVASVRKANPSLTNRRFSIAAS